MDGEIRSDFVPAGWLRGRHAQTVWGRLARSRRQVRMRRESLTAPDGDTLFVDHLDAPAAENAPFLLVLHGLEGSSNSVYAQGILALAAREGLRAAVLNFRFCARDPLDLDRCIPNERPRLYHSGETSDFDFVARTLAARFGRPLFVAGVSLGGNVLLKWLGENAGDPTVAAAATLSVPYDLAEGDRYMARFPSNLYVRSFVKTLTAKAEHLVAPVSRGRREDRSFARAPRVHVPGVRRRRHGASPRFHRRGRLLRALELSPAALVRSWCRRSASRRSTIRSCRRTASSAPVARLRARCASS